MSDTENERYPAQVQKVLQKLSSARDSDKLHRIQAEAKNTLLNSEIQKYQLQIQDLKLALETQKSVCLKFQHDSHNDRLEIETLFESNKILNLENKTLRVSISKSFKSEEESFRNSRELFEAEKMVLEDKLAISDNKLRDCEKRLGASVREAASWNDKYLKSASQQISQIKQLSHTKSQNEILKSEVQTLQEWQDKVKAKYITMKSIQQQNESLKKQNKLLFEINQETNKECDNLSANVTKKSHELKQMERSLNMSQMETTFSSLHLSASAGAPPGLNLLSLKKDANNTKSLNCGQCGGCNTGRTVPELWPDASTPRKEKIEDKGNGNTFTCVKSVNAKCKTDDKAHQSIISQTVRLNFDQKSVGKVDQEASRKKDKEKKEMQERLPATCSSKKKKMKNFNKKGREKESQSKSLNYSDNCSNSDNNSQYSVTGTATLKERKIKDGDNKDKHSGDSAETACSHELSSLSVSQKSVDQKGVRFAW